MFFPIPTFWSAFLSKPLIGGRHQKRGGAAFGRATSFVVSFVSALNRMNVIAVTTIIVVHVGMVGYHVPRQSWFMFLVRAMRACVQGGPGAMPPSKGSGGAFGAAREARVLRRPQAAQLYSFTHAMIQCYKCANPVLQVLPIQRFFMSIFAANATVFAANATGTTEETCKMMAAFRQAKGLEVWKPVCFCKIVAWKIQSLVTISGILCVLTGSH